VLPILIDGIVQGLQLSLLAVGITLIYGLGGILNLAHGQFAVVAGISTALFIDNGLNAVGRGKVGGRVGRRIYRKVTGRWARKRFG